jgi:hypothetical protein
MHAGPKLPSFSGAAGRVRLARYVPLAGLAAALAILAASPRASAQSASVQAQSLFDQGRKLIKAGKIAAACDAFESSHKLDPAVTTLLNLAECRAKNGQIATAWGAFADANRMARASKNAKLARVASNHARKLEPRLSRLTITVPASHEVTGLEIRRNDQPVDRATWNHALPIDGGTYTITARAPGRTVWSGSVTIKPESDSHTIEIPRLADPKAVAATRGKPDAAVAGTPTRPDRTAPSPAAERTQRAEPSSVASVASVPGADPAAGSPSDRPARRRSLMWPITLGTGALACGGAALAFHLSGNRTYERAKDAVDPAERDSLYNAANTRRYLAQGFGVAALGLAGTAVFVYLRGRGSDAESTAAVAPVVSPGLAGLAVVGRW